MTTAELIEKLERADGPSRELFQEAATVFWGRDSAPSGIDPDFWVKRWVRFNRMLDAEAWESAALMLVPEGQGRWPQLYYVGPNPNNHTRGHRWEIWADNRAKPYQGHHKRSAAIALVLAALKAKEADNG